MISSPLDDSAGPAPAVDLGERARLLRVAVATLLGRVRQAREDFLTFYELVWYTPTGEPIKVAPVHQQWIDALEKAKNVLLLAPRLHGKSELLSARVLWELGRRPNLRIKICAQSDKRARTLLKSIKHHLVKNPLVPLVFPNLRRDRDGIWTNTQISVVHGGAARDPSIDALGILSTVVGGRADLLWADDPMDYRMALLQPRTREAAKAKWVSEWLPTVEPTGRTWVAMTPWSRNDLAAATAKTPGWHVVRTPVGDDADPFKPIWPEKYDRAALMAKRQEWGPIDYDRAMRLRVYAEDVAPVRPAWIHYYNRGEIGDPDRMFCVVAFDLAISQAASADYFAYCVVLYDAERNLSFIVDAKHDRLSFLEQATTVLSVARQWNADRIVIEQANYEGALAEYVEELARAPIPIVTVKPRLKKARRLLEITPLLERGRVWFHPKLDPKRGDNAAALARDGDLVSELINFPNDEHDDLADSCAWALQSVREMGAETGPGQYGEGTVGVSTLVL